MNVRRGLFRLWVVATAGYLLLAAAYFFRNVREEFAAAALFRHGLTRFGDEALVPVPCAQARGKEGVDFSKLIYPEHGNKIICWYSRSKVRTLFPEYSDLSDGDLTNRAYKKAGIERSLPHPWTTLMKSAGLLLLPPLVLLLVGWSLVWAFAGFRKAGA
jgi:hypothetical protein